MSTETEARPDVDRHLEPLKPFQRDAVDYIFEQMFEADDPQRRFLLADEVGLGKTLVARGLIARAADWLWDRVDRVDVVYICSNRNIASQNINRLNVTDQESRALPTRLTMLPLRLPEIADRKLSLVSLTPGTSFNLASRGGHYKERMVLYFMLRQIWDLGPSKRYVNALRCGKGHGAWRGELDWFEDELRSGAKELNDELIAAFAERIERDARTSRQNGDPTPREEFEEVAEMYKSKRTTKRPWSHRDAQLSIVSRLRELLADASIEYLTPDLIILDEFQRFKKLLDGDGAVAELAHRLFNYADDREASAGARVLLLSATPYKMYTMHHEASEEDHYEDFFRTLDFLYGEDEARKQRFKNLLRQYRMRLLGRGEANEEELAAMKAEMESILREVMLRTERFKEIDDREGLIRDITGEASLAATDVEQYSAASRLRRDYDVRNLVEYWKSSPYLPSFMGHNYKLKRQIDASLDADDDRDPPAPDTLEMLEATSIDHDRIADYESIDLANARLRELVDTAIDEPDSWKILWTPASLPYWQHRGRYEQPAEKDFTKTLVFSSWKMVPDVTAVLGSYEAERRMMAESDYDYDEIGHRAPRLTFSLDEGRPSEMASMALFYPCISLADAVDPADIASELATDNGPPTYDEIRDVVAERITDLLASAGIDVTESGSDDVTDLWKYMARLDAARDVECDDNPVLEWLRIDDESPALRDRQLSHEGLRWQAMVGGDGEPTGFSTHVSRLRDAFESDGPLSITPRVVERLTDVALAAPATVTLRALRRHTNDLSGDDLPLLLAPAARLALGLRRRLNQGWIIECLTADDDSAYWQLALDHCRDGNLQAVLDEFFHITVESEGWTDFPDWIVANNLAVYTESVLSIRPASLSVDAFDADDGRSDSRKMRTHFALRLGDDQDVVGESDAFRGSIVRKAFNSPFHPFVLSTTSIGQEGLDFHQFCHAIFHWNLPANPVDLEQREGRINRYKGHVIRRNVARTFGLPGLANSHHAPHDDPWETLFALAETETTDDTCGLQPFWIYEADKTFKLRRHVPAVPFSQDLDRLDNLKSGLMYYRMVFGQPRQQDLVDHLRTKYAHLSPTEIDQKVREFYIDLSPPSSGERGTEHL